MARIKFVLNERRLGLIAVVGPTMNQPEVPVPTWMDPSGTHLAMRGVVPLPVYTKSTRKGRRMAQAAHGGNPRSETGKPEGQAGDLNPVVATEEVAKEEVESRDEGWGGGKEAERFVAETKVDGGNEVEVAIGESDVDGREEPEHLVSTTDVDSGKLAELFVARSGRRRRKRDADGSRKEAELSIQ